MGSCSALAGLAPGPTGPRAEETGPSPRGPPNSPGKSQSCREERKQARPRTPDQGRTWGEGVGGERAGGETAPGMCMQERSNYSCTGNNQVRRRPPGRGPHCFHSHLSPALAGSHCERPRPAPPPGPTAQTLLSPSVLPAPSPGQPAPLPFPQHCWGSLGHLRQSFGHLPKLCA